MRIVVEKIECALKHQDNAVMTHHATQTAMMKWFRTRVWMILIFFSGHHYGRICRRTSLYLSMCIYYTKSKVGKQARRDERQKADAKSYEKS
ncbi:MAG: hypothetical protein ACE5OR_13205 [bacterium]